ncbi:unnamed protein product [Amoebophrya sp. A120]|nr:unnamed protein product [Amoebophrya sp. A120]|eukprot:GSA120T00007377001.1
MTVLSRSSSGSSFDYVACSFEAGKSGLVNAGLLLLLDYSQNQTPITARRAGVFFGGCYLYQALQCPLEALTNRRSASHNFYAGGLLGAVGVHYNQLGVPFLTQTTYRQLPQWVKPVHAGFVVYGGIAMGFAMLMGKPL